MTDERMMIETSFFRDIYDNQPKKKALSLEDTKKIFEGEMSLHDTDNKPLEHFNFGSFFKKRSNEDVQHMKGIVFDIDEDDDIFHREKLSTYFSSKNVINFTYWTQSHKKDSPCWRLVIPWSHAVHQGGYYEHMGQYLIQTIESLEMPFHKMIDPCWKVKAQMYRLPLCKTDSSWGESMFLMNPFAQEPIPGVKLPKYEKENYQKTSRSKLLKNIPSQEEASHALSYFDPDCSYEEWIKIGMALQHGYGNAGFALWDKWSQRGARYPKKQEMSTEAHWKSFDPHGAVTISSLFFHAKQKGYEEGKRLRYDAHQDPIAEIEKEEEHNSDLGSDIDAILRLLHTWGKTNIYDPPGFMGEMYREFDNMLPQDQPEYALGVSITLMSLLKGRLVKDKRMQCNLYTLLVGDSFTGKSYASSLIGIYLESIECSSLLIPSIGSIQGFAKLMLKRGGRLLLSLDEGTMLLQGKNAPNVQSWELKTFSSFLTLFAESQWFKTPETKSEEAIEVPNPFLSIIQLAPFTYYQNLLKEDFDSGYMRRLLIFEGERFVTERHDYPINFSKDLIQKGKLLMDIQYGNTFFDSTAEEMFKDFSKALDNIAKVFSEPTFVSVILGTKVLAKKVALACCEVDFDRAMFFVTGKVASWAISVAAHNLKKHHKVITNYCHENKQAALFHKLWKVITKLHHSKKKLTSSNLLKYCHGLRKGDRDGILSSMEEEGLIAKNPVNPHGFVLELTERGKRVVGKSL